MDTGSADPKQAQHKVLLISGILLFLAEVVETRKTSSINVVGSAPTAFNQHLVDKAVSERVKVKDPQGLRRHFS